MGEEVEQVLSKRIFINNVDQYSSKFIAKYLSTCVAGESSEEAEAEPEEEPSSQSSEGQTAGFGTFKIVGTVSASSKEKLSFLQHAYPSPSRSELLGHLLQCDVVVYNISESTASDQVEEATWALTELHSKMGSFKSQKLFILVSSVMTWALTKPPKDDPDAHLTDEDYRKRRPHPSFKEHNTLEKLVLKLGREKKSKLSGYAVASGLQYGRGENIFHYFFKASWSMPLDQLALFGPGLNQVPIIHVNDLASVIQNTIDHKPKSHYILAVDDSKNTLEEIVMMISETLGPGKIQRLPKEEAILMRALEPEELECLSVDQGMEAPLLKDIFNIRWTSESGMVENMERIVSEYKHFRQLLPIRIFLTGPPAVGKSTVAQKLCDYYKLHHIKVEQLIREKIQQLEEILSAVDQPENSGEDKQAETQEQLEAIQESLVMDQGVLADHLMIPILKEKLNSKPCAHQGFVLDGFPETYEQAKMIFLDEDSDAEEGRSKIPGCNKRITPEHVFVLDASDTFLSERAQSLPQGAAEEAGYTREAFVPRLAQYRLTTSLEETLWDYFDEQEIHPVHIEVTFDDPESEAVLKMITEAVGEPKNYGPSEAEVAEKARRLAAAQLEARALGAVEKRRRDEVELGEMAAKHEEWKRNREEVKRQERELMEARSLPLRNYLMKYVMPSLSQAMLDCCAQKPEDPIDYLAEHLLQNVTEDST
ncbi:unnamed protein product [Boreogadus saida]